jgi:hypothetical protein
VRAKAPASDDAGQVVRTITTDDTVSPCTFGSHALQRGGALSIQAVLFAPTRVS